MKTKATNDKPAMWDGWIEDTSKAPHEAITQAIESGKALLLALDRLRPQSLKCVAMEIDAQVGKALSEFVRGAHLDLQSPGKVVLELEDGRHYRRSLNVLKMAKEIAALRPDDFESSAKMIKHKQEWAAAFDRAASQIRKSLPKDAS